MTNRRGSERSPKANVIRAAFIAAGRHHPQYMRPFEVNATEDGIEDMLGHLGNLEFDTDSIGGWGGDLIGCVAQVDGRDEALIPHGWDADRLRFFMHVQIPDRMSNDTVDYYVTGFTENDTTYELEGGDITMSPDTRMFINSIMRLRRTSGQDISDLIGGSTDDRLSIESNSHSLIGYTDDDVHNRSHTDMSALRPYDIAAKLDSYEEDYVMDSRSDFSNSLTKSSQRGNATSNQWLGRTIKALNDSRREATARTDWRNQSDTNPFISAQRILGETDHSKCKLQRLLKRETSYLRNGYLTWEEAENIFDGISDEQYTSIMREADVEKRSGRTNDVEGENLNGADAETVAAYAALNSISGIMMECCIMQAHIVASVNRRGDIAFAFQRDTVPIFFVRGMSEEDEKDQLFLFERRMKQFVLAPLQYKVNSFELDANMDALGDSQMFISIQGDEDAEFWGATFADGSTSSLLTSRRGTSDEQAEDVKRISDALIGRR